MKKELDRIDKIFRDSGVYYILMMSMITILLFFVGLFLFILHEEANQVLNAQTLMKVSAGAGMIMTYLAVVFIDGIRVGIERRKKK